MKILCVSDQIDPLIYNQNAKKHFPDIDLILCAGDLPMDYVDFIESVFNKPTYFVFGNHDLSEFKYYHSTRAETVAAVSTAAEQTQVYGGVCLLDGHGRGAIYAGFRTAVSRKFSVVDKKTGKTTPLLITGVSGSRRYNNGLCQYTESQMMRKLLFMVPKLLLNKLRYGRFTDIFLTHATPRHIHDHEDPCHVGFECFNWFLKTFSPSYMVHGHIHLYDQREERSGKYFNTHVVNAYAHCIIDFPLPESTKNQQTDKNGRPNAAGN